MRERERGVTVRVCFCVGERHSEKEEGCRPREREKPSWLSDLGCGEDTQEKCIPEAASEEKAQIREDRAEKS